MAPDWNRRARVRLSLELLVLVLAGCGETEGPNRAGPDFSTRLKEFPGSAIDSVLTDVRSVVPTDDGSLYVLGSLPPHLLHFSGDGRLLEASGGEGDGPGEFSRPALMARVGQELWVLDGGEARVWSTAPLREARRVSLPHGTLAVNGACGFPGAIAVGSDGGDQIVFNLFRQSGEHWEKLTDHGPLEVPLVPSPRGFRVGASGDRLALFHWQKRELQVLGCDGSEVVSARFAASREPPAMLFPRGMSWVGETVLALYSLDRHGDETMLLAWGPDRGTEVRQMLVDGDYRLEAAGTDRIIFAGFNPVPRLHRIGTDDLWQFLAR